MRLMRNEFPSPTSAAPNRMSSATWRAIGRASVLMRMISCWMFFGSPASTSRLGVAHDLGVVLERLGDLLLVGDWQHAAVLRHLRERERERREHGRACTKARPNERPNEPAAEFTAASLTRSSEIGLSV